MTIKKKGRRTDVGEKSVAQRGAKNFCMFEFPAFLSPRAAEAQPISSDGTCVTELNKVFLLDPVQAARA